jgi:hypothetical protein
MEKTEVEKIVRKNGVYEVEDVHGSTAIRTTSVEVTDDRLNMEGHFDTARIVVQKDGTTRTEIDSVPHVLSVPLKAIVKIAKK